MTLTRLSIMGRGRVILFYSCMCKNLKCMSRLTSPMISYYEIRSELPKMQNVILSKVFLTPGSLWNFDTIKLDFKSIHIAQLSENQKSWVFKQGIQNWKYFCLRINTPKGNYWILRIEKSIFYVKNHWNLSQFFIEEYQFRSNVTIFV